jgi:hypothetical protein
MQLEVLERLGEGRRALKAAEWEEARSAFEAVLAVDELPEALDGYGLTLGTTPRSDRRR